jgi:translocation and assembly module TamB
VTQGGFRQFTFDTLAVNGGWSGGDIHGDLRLDQSAGRWLTVRGTVPTNLFSRAGPPRPVDLAIRSSSIDLGVVQGFTSSVSNVSGLLELDVAVAGVSQDPRFNGFIQVQDAAFLVAPTGARYAKGNARILLTPDNVTIESFRLEDDKGDPLELSGSAATHQLRLGEFAVELSATRFEFLQNELGDVDLNGVVTVSGNPAAPVISGDLAIDHARVAADKLLEYFDRPYATTARPDPSDPLAPATAAMSRWWDRTALRLRLQATDNLTLRGDNLRFRAGSVAGLGDVNVTLGGDLTLRKAAGESISLTGELRTDSGSYAFQGRRFAIDRDGTIRFTGNDAAPLISVSASREVAGVKIRVALTGSTAAPELELSSSPGLEQTDIISLLLFNAPANELVSGQRDVLAVQAAALSSGFIVNPAVSAIGRAIGLDFLQIEPEPADPGGTSFRLSAGRSVWRSLFVTYSREFGALDYNELNAEYSLTRYLKIKGDLTDAGGSRSRSTLFQRVEQSGIDLLFFFSY